MGKAAELAATHDTQAMMKLRDEFENQLLTGWPGALVHGAAVPRLPNTTSLCLPGVDAAGMIILLDQRGIECSGGSACHTASLHPSHVLEAMGYDASHAASTLRFSLSRMNSREEVLAAAAEILRAARHLSEQMGVLA